MQLSLNRYVLGLLIAVAVNYPAWAGFYGIGSSQQGSTTYSLATALATELSLQSGEQFRTEPHTSTFSALPLVNDGELDFNLGNAVEVSNGYHGEGVAKGRAAPNLRVVASLYPFNIALVVREDSNIRTYNDLRGKTLPSGFGAQPTVALLFNALLENTGLNADELTLLPVTNVAQAREDFVNGRIDASLTVIGGGAIDRVAHAVGGLRCLSLNTEAEALAAMSSALPVDSELLTPDSNLTCVNEAIHVMNYDYFIYAHKDLDDAIVYKVVEFLHRSKEKLTTYIPAFINFDPSSMNPDIGVPYHPGAEQFYRKSYRQ